MRRYRTFRTRRSVRLPGGQAKEREMRPAIELLTVAETYRADQLAMEAGVAGARLMENAGRAVAEVVAERFPRGRVAVLCGPGNNGGDGFVAARHLSAMGFRVRLALLGDPADLKGDAAHHAALWRGPVEELAPAVLDGADVAVDALFGAGLSRPLRGTVAKVATALQTRAIPTVAVDVPSGVMGDDGAILGQIAVRAAVTVTFFRRKPGHLLMPGRAQCGEVVVADIGIPSRVLDDIEVRTFANEPPLFAGKWPWRSMEGHKFNYGHAVVLGGGTMTGAGRLAARAALRAGAGLVSVAAPLAALPIYAAGTPSLITLPLEEGESLDRLLQDQRRNAYLIGPGAGVSGETRWRVNSMLASGRSLVLDADALTVFSDEPAALAGEVRGPTVLTPHEGEFRRLFPDLRGDKIGRARAASYAIGAVVLLKGPDTVIASPDGRAAVNFNAPPELATAGAGDVLAGIVLAGLAQGVDAFEAACAAAWLHGEAARGHGPGLIAEDLTERLPAALRWLRSFDE